MSVAPRPMDCDVAIVGGGPAGCLTAAHLPRSLRTLIFEEHERAGVPTQCAGLVTERVVHAAKAESAVLNAIDGALIHFPDGRALCLQAKGTKAVVVDRRRFDEHCRELALDAGAEYLEGHRYTGLKQGVGSIDLSVNKGHLALSYATHLVVGADGYRSQVGQACGLSAPREFVRGIQVDLEGDWEERSSVGVYLGLSTAPGFFAWTIPCGEFVRVGLCIAEGHETPHHYLQALLGRLKLDTRRRSAIYSGVVPLGPPRRIVAERVLLVGDAAGQVKPLSGGGLYPGQEGARLAAKTIASAFAESDLSEVALRRYEREWRSGLGKEIERGYRVRKAFLKLDDADLNEVGRMLDREEVRNVLCTGDIDHPTALAPAILRNAPGLLRFSPQVLSSLVMG
jgi:digeranylgeranylglycerophospholipid reductase